MARAAPVASVATTAGSGPGRDPVQPAGLQRRSRGGETGGLAAGPQTGRAAPPARQACPAPRAGPASSDGQPSLPEGWPGCSPPTSGTWSPSATYAPHGARLPRRRRRAARARRPAGPHRVADLDLRTLRSWLAKQQTSGGSRTTLARRATAARVFTAWLRAHRPRPGRRRRRLGPRRRAARCPRCSRRRGPRAARGGRRRGRRRQPPRAARRGHAGAALRHRHPGRGAGRPRRRRRRPGAQRGPGDRQGPQGADRARSDARPRGRWTPGSHGPARSWASRAPGAALFLGARGRRIDQRAVRSLVHRRVADVPGAPTSARTGCGTPPPPTCSRAGPTCGRCRSCSGTPRWRPPSSTPTSPPTGCGRPTARPTPGPEGAGVPVSPGARGRTGRHGCRTGSSQRRSGRSAVGDGGSPRSPKSVASRTA